MTSNHHKQHTAEQTQWLKMREAWRNNKSHGCVGFANMAITEAGELVIGLQKSLDWHRYSAHCKQLNGVRSMDDCRWDLRGKNLGNGSDLNLKTVNSAVNTL